MWRACIGILYPGDGLLDREFWDLAPDGVSPLLTRTSAPDGEITAENVTAGAEDPGLEDAAAQYAVKLDSIAFACTSMSFIRGVGGDAEIVGRLERRTGVPSTTTSTAAVKALRAVGARRVSVATPYGDDINVRLVRFLEGHGFEVVNLEGMQLRGGIGLVPAGEVYQFARRAFRREADSLFIACTTFATVEILDVLERDLGVPVVSANQATMWEALRLARVRPVKPGCGSLFDLPATAPEPSVAGTARAEGLR